LQIEVKGVVLKIPTPIGKSIEKPIITIDDFFSQFKKILDKDCSLEKGFKFEFELHSSNREKKKETPFIYLAKPKDASTIAYLYRTTYFGKYPYREMQDSDDVLNLMESGKYNWVLFKNYKDQVIGCMGFYIDFDNKKGYLFGFVVLKEFREKIAAVKTFIAIVFVLWNYYKNQILLWYSETRTALTTPQYGQNLSGLRPIAFFPNKDLFFDKFESEFFHVIYDKKLLNQYRSPENPRIIRQVLNSYLYTNKLYNLGKPIIENPKININSDILINLEDKYLFRSEMRFNTYEKIKLSLKDSGSFFQFLYNHKNKSAENSEFLTNTIEELQYFLTKIKEIIENKKIRYFQCFVSSYKPKNQKLFLDNGFRPYGYIPSWMYNKEANLFEDSIVFINLKGSINQKLKLIPQTKELIQSLGVLN
jgi:hypothetical protein